MANSLDLLRLAHAAHHNHRRAMACRKRSKDRAMWLKGARRCVAELTAWVMSVDGRWRNRYGGPGSRQATTPSRTARDLVQDLFYDTPGAWYGSVGDLLRAGKPWGVITVATDRLDQAKAFLRQYVRVTGVKASREEGGTRLMLKPRKRMVSLLSTGTDLRKAVARV